MAGYVKQVDRSVNLSERDLVIITSEIKFIPSDDKIFTYTVANDFAESLVSVMARDALKDVELPIKRVNLLGGNKTVIWF
jgi:hypothetical protein